ncbi:MAG: alpha-L-fucosidase [Roseburia sp.]
MHYNGFEEDKRLVVPVPTNRQLAYQQMEFFGFVHFTVNTFTGREWGDGTEEETVFCPTNLDCEQWARTGKEAGMRGMVMTCKHHDGFCLWPSKYTTHTVANSPCKVDVVKEMAEACKRHGLKFGIYLSPWDRNCSLYGRGKVYDDYFVNQLEELLTNYGELYSVWFDGACGEGSNGKKQIYDWNRYYTVIRKLQPNACITVCGPDVRWCGNEAGEVRESEWSVVSAQVANNGTIMENSQQEDTEEFRSKKIDVMDQDLGSRSRLKNEADIIYYPAETDVSIRPGWFYHEQEDGQVKNADELFQLYLDSVGGNTSLLLNIPPNKEGRFHKEDVMALQGLGKRIRESFSNNIAERATITVEGEFYGEAEALKEENYHSGVYGIEGKQEIAITLNFVFFESVHYVVLKEDITRSQRVEKFEIICNVDGKKEIVFEGTTIGYKKIIPMKIEKTDQITIQILDSRVSPNLSFVGVY